MKRNFTKEDIRKVLLQNYKEELKKVSKEYEKISLKQDNFKVLDYDFLDKNIKDLQFKIYQLEKHII